MTSEQDARSAYVKRTFDTVAQAYDSPVLRFFIASSEHLAASLHLNGDERVVDVATGTGNAALALAKHLPQGQVVGIDFSAGMLAIARGKAAALQIGNLRFIEMDMQQIALRESGFDAATCAFGIFFVEDMLGQLSRIASLVKDGGSVGICNFTDNYMNPLRDLMVRRLESYGVQIPPQTWKRIATESGCRELFEKAGLKKVRVEQKNMGYFLSGPAQWWEIIWNAGYRGMVEQLTPEAMERFRQEHLQEVAALTTADGLWLDVGVLFTTGTK